MENVDLSHLKSLKGKMVRTFKGGPESKLGYLLDVKADYIAVQTEQDGIVYYQSRHVKSTVEDSKNAVSLASLAQNQLQPSDAEDFHSLLRSMLGRIIQIDRGGPESRSGIVLDVRSDYVVLFTNDEGVIYYNLEHIKSVSQDVQNKKNIQLKSPDQYAGILPGATFKDLVQTLGHQWVNINRGGPEAVEGVLVDADANNLMIVYGQEIYRLTSSHIRSLAIGARGSNQAQQYNNNNNNQQNSDQKNDAQNSAQKSENKKSDSNRKAESNAVKSEQKQVASSEVKSEKKSEVSGKKEDKRENKKEGKKAESSSKEKEAKRK